MYIVWVDNRSELDAKTNVVNSTADKFALMIDATSLLAGKV